VARSIRIEYPGAFYHVMARGNRREEIFRDDGDWQLFLRTLGEACTRSSWRVHGWVLMTNHYHLFLETPEANLVAGMQWLQNSYTRRGIGCGVGFLETATRRCWWRERRATIMKRCSITFI